MASGGETGEPRHDPHQTPLDPERILRQLNDAGVEYVLIGGSQNSFVDC
jgi:heptaprenylglyceryl phosphate synthase